MIVRQSGHFPVSHSETEVSLPKCFRIKKKINSFLLQNMKKKILSYKLIASGPFGLGNKTSLG